MAIAGEIIFFATLTYIVFLVFYICVLNFDNSEFDYEITKGMFETKNIANHPVRPILLLPLYLIYWIVVCTRRRK